MLMIFSYLFITFNHPCRNYFFHLGPHFVIWILFIYLLIKILRKLIVGPSNYNLSDLIYFSENLNTSYMKILSLWSVLLTSPIHFGLV